jgi:hypothetical protein
VRFLLVKTENLISFLLPYDVISPQLRPVSTIQSNNTSPSLFMATAESWLQEKNVFQITLQERNELRPQFQTSIWAFDANVVINYAILFGMAAFIISKVTLMDSNVSRG